MSGDLDRDLADARAAAAARQRRQTRQSRRILAEETTFVSVLAELSRRGVEVALETAIGSRHMCRIERLSDEVVVVSTLRGTDGAGTTIALRHTAIAAVRPIGDDAELAIGEAQELPTITMTEVLTELADRDVAVMIRAGATTWSGRVGAVGTDVVTLTGVAGQGVFYARLESVSEIVFSASL